MNVLIKCAAISIIGTTLALLLKKDNAGTALLLGVSLVLFVLANAMSFLREIKSTADSLAGLTGLSGILFTPVIKIAGIGILTRITSDICRDAGQSAPASAVETIGSICGVYISLPLIETVVDMIASLIE